MPDAIAENLGSVLDSILPGSSTRAKIPRWPPDVFCLCAAILHQSGAYTRAVENQKAATGQYSKFADSTRKLGWEWRNVALSSRPLPEPLQKWWSLILADKGTAILDLHDLDNCVHALIRLLGAADEACFGLGLSFSEQITYPEWNPPRADRLWWAAEKRLIEGLPLRLGSTLCQEIHVSRARVLPKMHTPQTGLTIRSLSHHLAFCPGSELTPEWYSLATNTDSHSLNLLLIPAPENVNPDQFRASFKHQISQNLQRGAYGLFTFEGEGAAIRRRVSQLLKKAEDCVGRIDGVVLPELAVSPDGHDALMKAIVTEDRFLIAGVGRHATQLKTGENYVSFDTALPGSGPLVSVVQKKHHRWKLERSQIMQYGIGSNLHPEVNWWEQIELGKRKLMFASLLPWLTMTVLICEDLARPDPVGDLIRAVGPNLVICLLMDGPQLANRWPGRYASSLADDPGSSVLTLTSLGMSCLSRPQSGESRSRVIALWKDARQGTKELNLPEKAKALVLNITVKKDEEWTADGRGCHGISSYPILAGYHAIA